MLRHKMSCSQFNVGSGVSCLLINIKCFRLKDRCSYPGLLPLDTSALSKLFSCCIHCRQWKKLPSLLKAKLPYVVYLSQAPSLEDSKCIMVLDSGNHLMQVCMNCFPYCSCKGHEVYMFFCFSFHWPYRWVRAMSQTAAQSPSWHCHRSTSVLSTMAMHIISRGNTAKLLCVTIWHHDY